MLEQVLIIMKKSDNYIYFLGNSFLIIYKQKQTSKAAITIITNHTLDRNEHFFKTNARTTNNTKQQPTTTTK